MCNEWFLCNERLKSENHCFLCVTFFCVQRVDVAETDQDLEDTGLARPKASHSGQAEEEEPPYEEQDTEKLMESVQSVKPKEVQAAEGGGGGGSLTADLHSKRQFIFVTYIPTQTNYFSLNTKPNVFSI